MNALYDSIANGSQFVLNVQFKRPCHKNDFWGVSKSSHSSNSIINSEGFGKWVKGHYGTS